MVMHARDTQHRLPPLGLVGIFLAFATAVALIPYTVTTGLIRLHRVRRLTRRQTCTQCGQPLGIPGLAEGKRVREAAVARAAAARDGEALREATRVVAACSRCEAVYGYDDGDRAFVPLSLRLPGMRA